jgi:hypothetical protein
MTSEEEEPILSCLGVDSYFCAQYTLQAKSDLHWVQKGSAPLLCFLTYYMTGEEEEPVLSCLGVDSDFFAHYTLQAKSDLHWVKKG